MILSPQGGEPLKFSESRSHVVSALVAEAVAVRSALQAIKAMSELSVNCLEVHSDTQVLVANLNLKGSSKELKAIIFDISCLSANLSSISFHFVPRHNNMVTDSLAKSALFAATSFSPRGL